MFSNSCLTIAAILCLANHSFIMHTIALYVYLVIAFILYSTLYSVLSYAPSGTAVSSSAVCSLGLYIICVYDHIIYVLNDAICAVMMSLSLTKISSSHAVTSSAMTSFMFTMMSNYILTITRCNIDGLLGSICNVTDTPSSLR